MKILGLIPARGGSKGIPGKNIRLLNGKPLLQYSIEAGKNSKLLDRLILSSEDPQIIEVALRLGVDVPYIRPAELAMDDTSSLSVVLHALDFFEARGEIFDAVCLLQPTSPFRKEGLIDTAIDKFTSGGFDSLISVRQVPEEFNPHWVFEEQNENLKISTGEETIIPRRQELPKAYHRDGSIYITRSEVLRDQHSLFGSKIGFIDTTGDPYVNIDDPSDWERAEHLLKSRS